MSIYICSHSSDSFSFWFASFVKLLGRLLAYFMMLLFFFFLVVQDPITKLSKRFLCNACHCHIESVPGLVEHCKGDKHVKRVQVFDPYEDKSKMKHSVFKMPRDRRADPKGIKTNKKKVDIFLTLR